MPAKIPYLLSFPMKIQLTSKQEVSLLRRPFIDMHNQKSVQIIHKPNLEPKMHLGGILPALQYVDLGAPVCRTAN